MKKAQGLTGEQVKMLQRIDLPEIEKMRIMLESPELVGLLEAEQLQASALENIKTNPELAAMQMQALQSLKQRAEGGGLTPEDKMQMEQMVGQVAAQEKAQRSAIEQEMLRQGTADSGQSAVMKQMASQNAANQGRQQALQMGAQASQNRMAAAQNMASVASGMEQNQYQRGSDLANARDAIARANAANRQQVNQQNLAAQQAIANQRATIRNQQEMHNKGLYQQDFQNKLSKSTGVAQAMGNQANMHAQQGAAQAQADAAMTQGLFGVAGEGVKGYFSKGKEDGGLVYKDGGMCHAEDGSVVFESNGKGQVVGGNSMAGDRVDAKLNSGEAVLNVAQQQRLMDMIRGKLHPKELGEEDIVEGVPKEYQQDLKNKVDSNEDVMENGMKKLLKILGSK
jgi:hypothetical protein